MMLSLVSDLQHGSRIISVTSNSNGVGKNGKYQLFLWSLLDNDDV